MQHVRQQRKWGGEGNDLYNWEALKFHMKQININSKETEKIGCML